MSWFIYDIQSKQNLHIYCIYLDWGEDNGKNYVIYIFSIPTLYFFQLQTKNVNLVKITKEVVLLTPQSPSLCLFSVLKEI